MSPESWHVGARVRVDTAGWSFLRQHSAALPGAGQRLASFSVARVAADAAVVPQTIEPLGWPELVYYRLHGSPEMDTSPYPDDYLRELARWLELAARDGETWCIFDNSARGIATENAPTLAQYHS